MVTMVEERWMAIEGFEGRYEISNHGRVRSLCCAGGRYATMERNYRKVPKILKGGKNPQGYWVVKLYNDDREFKQFSIHTLVLIHFGSKRPEETDTYWDAAHLDHNKNNNAIWNLQWQTHKDNCQDKSIRIFCYRLDGVFVKEYTSMHEAKLDGFDSGGVWRCCHGKLKTHKKHKFIMMDA
jgi:hypothetical protein